MSEAAGVSWGPEAPGRPKAHTECSERGASVAVQRGADNIASNAYVVLCYKLYVCLMY